MDSHASPLHEAEAKTQIGQPKGTAGVFQETWLAESLRLSQGGSVLVRIVTPGNRQALGGRPVRESRTPVNMGKQPHRDNGEVVVGIIHRPLLYPLVKRLVSKDLTVLRLFKWARDVATELDRGGAVERWPDRRQQLFR